MYTDTWAKVVTKDGNTDAFEILTGILQGDTLSPYIFIICIDFCMKKALEGKDELGFVLHPRRSRRYPERRIEDLKFR